MAKYTTQVRSIIEANSTPGKPITDRIKESCPKIFNFPFPIWLESYRETLEYKILLHYFSKEIGFETVGLWKLYLNQRLNEIMPYYNDLYLTTTQKFSNAYDMDVTETLERELNGADETQTDIDGKSAGTTNTNNSASGETLQTDYPGIAVDNTQDGEFYGTSGNKDTSTQTGATTDSNTQTTTSKSKGNSTTTEKHKINRKGITGSKTPWEIIQSYRNSLINIDVQIIRELKDLFMMIY